MRIKFFLSFEWKNLNVILRLCSCLLCSKYEKNRPLKAVLHLFALSARLLLPLRWQIDAVYNSLYFRKVLFAKTHLRLPQTPLPPAPLDSSQRLFRNTLDKIVSMRKFSLIESAFSVYEIGQAASSSSLNTFGEPKWYRLSNLETQCNARGDECEFLARPVYDWLLLLLPNSSCFTMATGVSPSLSWILFLPRVKRSCISR